MSWNGGAGRQKSKPKYVTPSDIITSTAESQTGKSYKAGEPNNGSAHQTKKRESTEVKKKRRKSSNGSKVKRLSKLEKKIKKHRF